jgi:uncharacterized membrane protein YdjX (TVP38/TMEM64 family)
MAILIDMDARAWRAVAVSLLLIAAVGAVFVFGGRLLGEGHAASARHWLAAARGPWGLPVAIAAFAALAFLGAPQFVLIAAAVVVFGPWLGAAYSWIGTMVSALIGFWLGRVAGADLAGRLKSAAVDRFMALIGRNGFTASLVIRLAPFAPFVIVNMAAGMTRMRLADFTAGTALGIVPKIALTAFAGGSVLAAMNGGPWRAALLAAAAAVWIAVAVVAGRWTGLRKNLPR